MTKAKQIIISVMLGLAMIACALLLTACGGSGNTTAGSATLDVKGKRFGFEKVEVQWSSSATKEQKTEVLANFILENPNKPNATEVDYLNYMITSYINESAAIILEFTNEQDCSLFYEGFTEPEAVVYYVQDKDAVKVYEFEGYDEPFLNLKVSGDRIISYDDNGILFVKMYFKVIK